MVVCIKTIEVHKVNATPKQTITTKNSTTSLAEVLVPKSSPSSLNTDRNIVFVIDALEEFPWRSFKWTLDHLIPTGCTVTLLGVMPWIPLACKVVSRMQLAMGHPLKLVVLEKTTSIHASLVVLDRHIRKIRKNKAYFAEKLPSSVVTMNNDGGVDMFKIQSKIIKQRDLSPGESPATLPPIKLYCHHNYLNFSTAKVSNQQQLKNEACRATADSLLTRTRREIGQLFLGKAM